MCKAGGKSKSKKKNVVELIIIFPDLGPIPTKVEKLAGGQMVFKDPTYTAKVYKPIERDRGF